MLQSEILDRVVALQDVYLAFMALTPVAPYIYIAASQAIADPLQTQVSQRARQRGYQSRAGTVRTVAITRATRRALRLPTVPLQPFTGLAPSLDDHLITQGVRLAEVNAQAAYVHEDRWAQVDVQAVCDAVSFEPWITVFRPEHDLPMHLVLMLVRKANPTWHSGVCPGGLSPSSPPLACPPLVCPQGPLPGNGATQHASRSFCPFAARPASGR